MGTHIFRGKLVRGEKKNVGTDSAKTITATGKKKENELKPFLLPKLQISLLLTLVGYFFVTIKAETTRVHLA